MKMQKSKLIKSQVGLIVLQAIILFGLILILKFRGTEEGSKIVAATTQLQGRQYLQAAESQDAAAVEDAIFEGNLDAQLELIDEKMAEDPDYVWTALSDINTVILGDSRVAAFKDYGFMDESHIIADYGIQMDHIIDMDKIAAVNPKLVVLAFGLNDIGGDYETPWGFAQGCMDYADQIRAMLPEAYVYIQVSFRLSPYGATTGFAPVVVDSWYEGTLAYYEENGAAYLDLNYLTEQYTWLYADDGFHFRADFYPLWARAILERYLTDAAADRQAELLSGMQPVDAEK